MTRRTAVALALLLWSVGAAAHVPFLRGHLLDLVQNADRIVIARVDEATRRPAGDSRLKLTVLSTITGKPRPPAIEVLSPSYLAPGSEQVLFLKNGEEILSLAPRGASFASDARSRDSYRRAIGALRQAINENSRARSLRAVLLAALRSPAPSLRYEAALALNQLQHDGPPLTAAEAHQLKQLLADPKLDPVLAPLLQSLLR